MNECMRGHVCAYIYICVCVCVCVYVCMYVCMYAWSCVCACPVGEYASFSKTPRVTSPQFTCPCLYVCVCLRAYVCPLMCMCLDVEYALCVHACWRVHACMIRWWVYFFLRKTLGARRFVYVDVTTILCRHYLKNYMSTARSMQICLCDYTLQPM